MKAHELQTEKRVTRTRSGRGISAGRGKTAGRGTKGQNSRAGGKRRPGFEGGQNPMIRRIPKARGFRSFRTKASVVTTGQLDELGVTVNNKTLFKAGLVAGEFVDVKVVLKGEVKKKHTVEVQGASSGAIAAIEAAGGSFKQAGRAQRPKSKKSE